MGKGRRKVVLAFLAVLVVMTVIKWYLYVEWRRLKDELRYMGKVSVEMKKVAKKSVLPSRKQKMKKTNKHDEERKAFPKGVKPM